MGLSPLCAPACLQYTSPVSGVDVMWIPLGAGGSGIVRVNGRIYERLVAWRERRAPLALLHTALLVRTDEGTWIVETMWPSPAGDPAERGVVVTAPVWFGPLGRFRLFRHEVRRWRDGILPDADQAIGGPDTVTAEPAIARRLLDLVPQVPALIWGRRVAGADMWNSNSVIAWLLTRAGLPIDDILPPAGYRAPGWDAGIAVARLTPR